MFQHPDVEETNKTVFLGFEGKGTAFDKDGMKLKFMKFSDGLTNTIYCVEANPDAAIEWTKPADIEFDSEVPVSAVGKIGDKGFGTAFCDAAVRTLANNFDPKAFSAFVGRNEGKLVKLTK